MSLSFRLCVKGVEHGRRRRRGGEVSSNKSCCWSSSVVADVSGVRFVLRVTFFLVKNGSPVRGKGTRRREIMSLKKKQK